jgi:hypothetical protein
VGNNYFPTYENLQGVVAYDSKASTIVLPRNDSMMDLSGIYENFPLLQLEPLTGNEDVISDDANFLIWRFDPDQ